jgi:polar amino acid transport system substrate-binding protein
MPGDNKQGIMNKTYFISGLLCTLAMVLTPIASARTQHLRINCTLHSPYEQFFFALIKEIGHRNDITITRTTPPVGRSLIQVNQGIDDGDGPRIGGLESSFPNLICVPEPFGEFAFGAFTRNQSIRIQDWKDLSDLNVAYIHGWKIFDIHVTAAKSITKVRDVDLLFTLLTNDRADAVLITRLAGYHMIHDRSLKNIHFIEPPLATKPNYLYLHQQHAPLASLFADTLREIKRNGTYATLFQEIIAPYLPDLK